MENRKKIKILCLPIFALLLGVQTTRAEDKNPTKLICTFGSRNIKALTNLTPLSIDLAVGGIQKAEFGNYAVTLIPDSAPVSQASLVIVDKKNNLELHRTLWQSLREFQGINIVGGHGFTGLNMVLNYIENLDKGNPTEELQYWCNVL